MVAAFQQLTAQSQPGDMDQGPDGSAFEERDVSGWKETVQGGKRLLTSYGLKHIVLRYEDLVTAPEAELRRLTNALDIDLTEGLKFYKADFIEGHTKRFKHLDNLTNPINPGSVGKWRKQMTDEEVKVFVDSAGEVMAEYGYLE